MIPALQIYQFLREQSAGKIEFVLIYFVSLPEVHSKLEDSDLGASWFPSAQSTTAEEPGENRTK